MYLAICISTWQHPLHWSCHLASPKSKAPWEVQAGWIRIRSQLVLNTLESTTGSKYCLGVSPLLGPTLHLLKYLANLTETLHKIADQIVCRILVSTIIIRLFWSGWFIPGQFFRVSLSIWRDPVPTKRGTKKPSATSRRLSSEAKITQYKNAYPNHQDSFIQSKKRKIKKKQKKNETNKGNRENCKQTKRQRLDGAVPEKEADGGRVSFPSGEKKQQQVAGEGKEEGGCCWCFQLYADFRCWHMLIGGAGWQAQWRRGSKNRRQPGSYARARYRRKGRGRENTTVAAVKKKKKKSRRKKGSRLLYCFVLWWYECDCRVSADISAAIYSLSGDWATPAGYYTVRAVVDRPIPQAAGWLAGWWLSLTNPTPPDRWIRSPGTKHSDDEPHAGPNTTQAAHLRRTFPFHHWSDLLHFAYLTNIIDHAAARVHTSSIRYPINIPCDFIR